jgi:hypothetical protein
MLKYIELALWYLDMPLRYLAFPLALQRAYVSSLIHIRIALEALAGLAVVGVI